MRFTFLDRWSKRLTGKSPVPGRFGVHALLSKERDAKETAVRELTSENVTSENVAPENVAPKVRDAKPDHDWAMRATGTAPLQAADVASDRPGSPWNWSHRLRSSRLIWLTRAAETRNSFATRPVDSPL